MEVIFLRAEVCLGTPFMDVHYELRDGSVLRAKGFIAIRQEWYEKPFSFFTPDDYRNAVVEKLKDWLPTKLEIDTLNFNNHPEAHKQYRFDRDLHISIKPSWFTVSDMLSKMNLVGKLPKDWHAMSSSEIADLFDDLFQIDEL
jgi:hypothetical protein